jgi:hypothetical protein
MTWPSCPIDALALGTCGRTATGARGLTLRQPFAMSKGHEQAQSRRRRRAART